MESATEVPPEIYGATTTPASGDYGFCAQRVSTPRTLPFEPAYRKIGTARLRDSAREVGMSRQLDSQHFYRRGDQVRASDARIGYVDDATTLYAVITWQDGGREEIEQFDPNVVVIERAER